MLILIPYKSWKVLLSLTKSIASYSVHKNLFPKTLKLWDGTCFYKICDITTSN